MSQLPGIAGEIEELIGLDLTVKLLKARGGTRVSIPHDPKGTILADLIGEDATRILAAELLPGDIELPCAAMRGSDAVQREKRSRALQMIAQGHSDQKVALACDLHLRTIKRYRAEKAKPDDQWQLPL